MFQDGSNEIGKKKTRARERIIVDGAQNNRSSDSNVAEEVAITQMREKRRQQHRTETQQRQRRRTERRGGEERRGEERTERKNTVSRSRSKN